VLLFRIIQEQTANISEIIRARGKLQLRLMYPKNKG